MNSKLYDPVATLPCYPIEISIFKDYFLVKWTILGGESKKYGNKFETYQYPLPPPPPIEGAQEYFRFKGSVRSLPKRCYLPTPIVWARVKST